MKKALQLFQAIKKEFSPEEKFTAIEVAERLMISRSLASNYLNQLVRLEIMEKDSSRPVRFFYFGEKDVFAELIGVDGSMEKIIQQCKASVNYPPNGLPIILKGNSGVGKSMLAKLIYRYAISAQVIEQDAPFVVLNCADYANNPELLSSTLFGYVKGAFTGADHDKSGFLDFANGGYLFLDEVHNLSRENQEKLFLLIDQKRFRRLGEEEKWCNANIRLILATTENIESNLLATFRRRIPLEITLPDYNQRSRKERIQLVYNFFQQESLQLKKNIWIDTQFFQSLLNLNVEGNVGAVQNEIKLACANSFNVYHDQQQILIPVQTDVTVNNLIKIPYMTATMRESFSNQSAQEKLIGEFIENRALSQVQEKLDLLLKKLKLFHDEKSLLLTDFDLIFSSLKNKLVGPNKFGIPFEEGHIFELALLIDLAGENSYKLKIDHYDNLTRYLNVADYILEAADRVNTNLLARDLVVAYLFRRIPLVSKRHALIVMHGKNLASSLATEVNNLVGDYVFDAFDMPIQVETKEIVARVNEYVINRNTRDGLLLLVDMGSLEKMYEEIKDNVAGDLLIINNVSTSLGLHIGFALLQNQPMEYYTSIDYQKFNVKPQYFEGLSQIENIVISCMSGEGIAQKIKDIFAIQQSQRPVELITLDFEKLLALEEQKPTTSFRNTCAIISTSPVTIPGVRCLNLEGIVNGTENFDNLKDIYSKEQLNIITNEIIKLFTIEGASARLRFLNPDMVINEVETIIHAFEEQYKIKFKNFIRVNLFLHLSSMIERLLINDFVTDDGPTNLTAELAAFIQTGEDLFAPIKEKYNIAIPIREYEYIYRIISL
ncbi:sigma 54-interacting transcriptional regulator [Enterococcus canintestini]|uniref:DNA translocase FtsK n=1 Tax=Enterococcus canintestini TaxID=317010 RepID=A0A267HTC2_9ENTE|nr:sigma 54-interacting transcriptional regulator [Enterococcus canintestini]PAB01619.1 hypothetical protein AKL21_03985 [Enterococcus canintestini]